MMKVIKISLLYYKMPSIIDNPELYEKAKRIVYEKYQKNSAYRSGQLVKLYKQMGGTYSGTKTKGGLTSWFQEGWRDINPNKTEKSYPVYRPTKRVNKNTPLILDEIDPKNLLKQIRLKQKYKGDKNLPAYKQAKILGKNIQYM